MAETVTIKRGASLELTLQFTDDDNRPVDLTGAVLTSQVRDALGDIVSSLPLTISPSAGVAEVFVADTSQWPTGLLRCDARMVLGGRTVLTQTFGIKVEAGVTR